MAKPKKTAVAQVSSGRAKYLVPDTLREERVASNLAWAAKCARAGQPFLVPVWHARADAEKLDRQPERERASVLCDALESVVHDRLAERHAYVDSLPDEPKPAARVTDDPVEGAQGPLTNRLPKHDDRLWAVRGLPEENHPPFVPGDRVLLGNLSHGPTGRISWWVVACECERCASGEFVALDEALPDEYYGGGQKHIRCAGLQRKGDINELSRDRAVDVLAMLGTGHGGCVATGIGIAELSIAWTQGTTHDGYVDPTTVHGAYRNELRRVLDTVLPYLSAPPATIANYHLGRMRRCESKTGILHNWSRYIAHSLGGDIDAANAYGDAITKHAWQV